MNTWGWFILGFFVGFLLSSFLLGWHARQSSEDAQRLSLLVAQLREELRKKNSMSALAFKQQNRELDHD